MLIEGQSGPSYSRSEEVQPRERVLDDMLGSLLSSIANNEAKAILLGTMEDGTAYTARELSDRINAIQGIDNRQPLRQELIRDYFYRSLIPAGLVTEKFLIDGGNSPRFQKTTSAIELGDSLTGIALDFSSRHDGIALYDVFASKSSSYQLPNAENEADKKRAAMLRLRILREVVNSHLPLTATNVAKALNEDEAQVGIHLKSLSENGIVNYNSTGLGENFIAAIFIADVNHDKPKPKVDDSIIKFAFEILEANPGIQITGDEIVKLYNLTATRTGKQLITNTQIREVFSRLKELGFIETASRTKVSLTDEQREVLEELLGLIDRFQEMDSQILAFGKIRLKEIAANPSLVGKLLKKAREHSPYANRQPRGNTLIQLKSLIAEKNGLRSGDIRNRLALLQGRKLSISTITDLLRILASTGDITVDVLDGVRYYKPAQEL